MKRKRIFSGNYSRGLWKEINALTAISTCDDVSDVLYSLGCHLQKLEEEIDNRLRAVEKVAKKKTKPE